MALSTNLIGNLVGRHLKLDPGQQGYNVETGRGYIFSGDGRIGVFVDYLHADGPKYAVSFSQANASALNTVASRASWITQTGNNFINKVSGYNLPTADTPSTSSKSLFYKAFDARVAELDPLVLTAFEDWGLTKDDFSNTAMLVEAWANAMFESAPMSDVSPSSGVRGVVSGMIYSHRGYKLWSEGASAGSSSSESIFVNVDPTKMTTAQLAAVVDAGGGGSDSLDYYFSVDSGFTVNFANASAQTLTYKGKTLNFKNFESVGMTDFADTFTGSTRDESIYAGRGADKIDGGGAWVRDANGNPTGRSVDNDWVTYSGGGAGITVKTHASTGDMTVTDFGGDRDILTNIEGIQGTWYKDRMDGGTGNFNQKFNGLKGADVINGGGGSDDRVWHQDDPSGVVVNLGPKSVNPQAATLLLRNSQQYQDAEEYGSMMTILDALQMLEAPSTMKVASNRALDGWGSVDTLSNIEGANGSAFNDQLYGSNGSNWLSGGSGFDMIVGNGGDDRIVGGYGHDWIHGGAGRDWIVLDELNWNALSNQYSSRYYRDEFQQGNIVVYKTVHESGIGSRADVIDGFILGTDVIDLSGIDANTKRAGNQAFDDWTVGSFTKTPGELRFTSFTSMNDGMSSSTAYKLNGVELQGDVNGDGLADFGVRLIGTDFDVSSSNTLASIAQRLLTTESLIL